MTNKIIMKKETEGIIKSLCKDEIEYDFSADKGTKQVRFNKARFYHTQSESSWIEVDLMGAFRMLDSQKDVLEPHCTMVFTVRMDED